MALRNQFGADNVAAAAIAALDIADSRESLQLLDKLRSLSARLKVGLQRLALKPCPASIRSCRF